MNGVRYTDLGFEGQCDECRDWWPLEPEFWPVGTRFYPRICRACHAGRRKTPVPHRYPAGHTKLSYEDWRRLYKREWMRRFRSRAA